MKKILYILLLFPILGTAQSYLAKSVNGNNADVNGNVTISTGSGTVTSIATDNTLTGGTITSSGTLKVDTAVISTKNYALNIGKQNLGLSYGDSISLSISGGNTIKFAYAVDSVSKIGDSLIVIKAGLRSSYSLGSSGGGSISGLTAATATNSINNLNYKQRWFANTIGADTAFVLGTSSTAAASNLQTVLSVNQSGANATSTQSTYGIKISNKKTGTASTNIGIDLDVSGGGTNNAINVTSGRVLLNGNSLVFGPASNMLEFTGSLNINANLVQVSPNAGTGQIHSMTCGGYTQFAWGMNASYNAPYFSMGGTVWNNGTTYYSLGTNSILFRDLAGDLSISQDASLSYGGTFTPTERIRFKANGTVGIGTSSPSANTKLEITTTTTMPIKLTPMTATQASALTAEDGGLIYVSDTNGTFTSIGFWGRENGVWVKL